MTCRLSYIVNVYRESLPVVKGREIYLPIEKVEFIWMDGKFVKWDEANIHILSHCIHYGTGVFEGIRGYAMGDNLSIFRLKEHIQRLYNSAKIYMMNVPYSVEEFSNIVIQLIQKNKIRKNCYVRPIVFRGLGEFGLNPFGSPTQYAIITFPLGAYLKEGGVRVCTSTWKRIPDDSMPSCAKTSGAYVNSILAKMEAVKKGYDEAILLDSKGYLSEGSGENLFLVRNGRIYTPPLSSSILDGITRRSVLDIATDHKIPITEIGLLKSELYICSEAFFTGTAAEITPILEIDDRPIGNGKAGPFAKLFREKFTKIIEGKDKKYRKWLTPVY